MILKRGDMWSAWDAADLFLITANACIKPDHRLVMGAGIAKQARDRWPGIDLRAGTALRGLSKGGEGFKRNGRKYVLLKPDYKLLVSGDYPMRKLGLFQVKDYFHASASTSLIRESASALEFWCRAFPEAQVHLNFPGIGNGRLKKDAVLPIIEFLPDSVHVWQFEREE